MNNVASSPVSGQISHDRAVDLLDEVLTSRIQMVQVIVQQLNLAFRIGQVRLFISVWLRNLVPLLALSSRSAALLSGKTNLVFLASPVVVSSFALSALDLKRRRML